MPRPSLILLGLLIGCGFPWPTLAQRPGEKTPTPDATLKRIVARLSSEQFQARVDAQRELDSVPVRQISVLEGLSKSATDPETRSRLQKRIDAMREELAVNPLPISLELKNATFYETVEALGKSVKSTYYPMPQRNDPADPRFTLSAHDKPLWEVFFALSRQHGLTFTGTYRQQIALSDPGLLSAAISGPIAFVPVNLLRSKSTTLQNDFGPEAQPDDLLFNVVVLIDPRLSIIKYHDLEFSEIRDDAGNDLCPAQSDDHEPRWQELDSGKSVLETHTNLEVPERLGKKITSAKGVMRLRVATVVDRYEIDNPQKKVHRPFAFAGGAFEITQCEVTSKSFGVSVEYPRGAPDNFLAAAREGVEITVSVVDGDGQEINSSTVPATMGRAGGTIKQPIKLVLSAPTRVKEITVPFEFQDLPIP